jgi:hypothetical protein
MRSAIRSGPAKVRADRVYQAPKRSSVARLRAATSTNALVPHLSLTTVECLSRLSERWPHG